MLVQVGRTEEGAPVLACVFKFFETRGMPLDELLHILKDRDHLPSWSHFYDEALAAGMKHERILAKLDPALSDVYGFEFRDVVIERLRRMYEGVK